MTLRDLTTAEMVTMSGPWTEPGHPDRSALERLAPVKAFLPHVEAVHATLLETQVDSKAAWLTGLSNSQRVLDGLHDSLARGIWLVLDGHVHLARSDEEAERRRALQAHVFPDGLRVVGYSYRREAGYGKMLASRLTAVHEEALAAIPTAEGNLLALVRTWIDVAEQLGRLEHERTSVPAPAVSSAAARGQWIRAVNTLRTLIETLGTDDPAVHEILARIDTVSAQGGRRDSDDTAPGDGADVDDAPGGDADAGDDVSLAPGVDPDLDAGADLDDGLGDGADVDLGAGGGAGAGAGPDGGPDGGIAAGPATLSPAPAGAPAAEDASL